MKKSVAIFFCFVSLSKVCWTHLKNLDLMHGTQHCGPCGKVYLTVTAKDNFFVANWRFACKAVNHPDKVSLYKRDTGGHQKSYELLFSHNIFPGQLVGHVKTNVSWHVEDFPGNWNPNNKEPMRMAACFPYYITAFLNGNIFCWSCYYLHPDWMSGFPDLRLSEMMLPGTIRSGAFIRYSHDPLFNVHQNFNLWGQLVMGIRYFDITVAANTRNNKNGMNNQRLQSQLSLIAEFLKKSTKEVVILDIRGFWGFNKNKHELLLKMLQESFGSLFIPKDFSRHQLGPKMSKLWAVDKRILVNYRHKQTALTHDWLWYDIFIKDGKAKTPEQLRKHIIKAVRNHWHDEMFCNIVAMIDSQNIRNPNEIRSQSDADTVNPLLHDWLTEKNVMSEVNIIVVEFFEGTRIVDDAIDANNERMINATKKNRRLR